LSDLKLKRKHDQENSGDKDSDVYSAVKRNEWERALKSERISDQEKLMIVKKHAEQIEK